MIPSKPHIHFHKHGNLVRHAHIHEHQSEKRERFFDVLRNTFFGPDARGRDDHAHSHLDQP